MKRNCLVYLCANEKTYQKKEEEYSLSFILFCSFMFCLPIHSTGLAPYINEIKLQSESEGTYHNQQSCLLRMTSEKNDKKVYIQSTASLIRGTFYHIRCCARLYNLLSSSASQSCQQIAICHIMTRTNERNKIPADNLPALIS